MAEIIFLQQGERPSAINQQGDRQVVHQSREHFVDHIVLLEENLSYHVKRLLSRLEELSDLFERIQDPGERRELQKMLIEKREILVRVSAQLEWKVKTLSLLRW